jgi:hypothetical protein
MEKGKKKPASKLPPDAIEAGWRLVKKTDRRDNLKNFL